MHNFPLFSSVRDSPIIPCTQRCPTHIPSMCGGSADTSPECGFMPKSAQLVRRAIFDRSCTSFFCATPLFISSFYWRRSLSAFEGRSRVIGVRPFAPWDGRVHRFARSATTRNLSLQLRVGVRRTKQRRRQCQVLAGALPSTVRPSVGRTNDVGCPAALPRVGVSGVRAASPRIGGCSPHL